MSAAPRSTPPDVRLHVTLGWWSLLLFVAMGIALEILHGFKVDWYLAAANETRRLMFRLSHAHGVLLSLVHVVYGVSLWMLPDGSGRWRRTASRALIGASVLLPGGFFAGGLFIYDGDPGLGVLLVPFGAVALVLAVALTARGTSRQLGR